MTTEEKNTENDNNHDGAIDRDDSHTTEPSDSLRASIESAWKEHTGKAPEGASDRDDKDDDRRRSAEPRGRAALARCISSGRGQHMTADVPAWRWSLSLHD